MGYVGRACTVDELRADAECFVRMLLGYDLVTGEADILLAGD